MTSIAYEGSVDHWLAYGGRFWVSNTIDVTADAGVDNRLMHNIKFRTAFKNGAMVCSSLQISGRDHMSITTDSLRSVRIGSLIELAITNDPQLIAQVHPPAPGGIPSPELLRTYEPPAADTFKSGIGHNLEEFIDFWCFCQLTGKAPTGELLKAYGIPRPTTTRWIERARTDGNLVENHEHYPGLTYSNG